MANAIPNKVAAPGIIVTEERQRWRHADARPRIKFSRRARTRAQQPHTNGNTISLCIILGLKMTKSRGIGRGGARPGSGRKPKAITPRVQALKDALAALKCGASKFGDADQRFVRAMIALGAPNSATASAFGISEAELLAKFPDELGSHASEPSRGCSLANHRPAVALP